MTGIGLTTGPFDAAAFGEITLAFSREEYLGRIAKLRTTMHEEGIDLLWITTHLRPDRHRLAFPCGSHRDSRC